MRQKIKLQIPRKLGILMQDPQLDKITLTIDHYDVILELVENETRIPSNQSATIHIKD